MCVVYNRTSLCRILDLPLCTRGIIVLSLCVCECVFADFYLYLFVYTRNMAKSFVATRLKTFFNSRILLRRLFSLAAAVSLVFNTQQPF